MGGGIWCSPASPTHFSMEQNWVQGYFPAYKNIKMCFMVKRHVGQISATAYVCVSSCDTVRFNCSVLPYQPYVTSVSVHISQIELKLLL